MSTATAANAPAWARAAHRYTTGRVAPVVTQVPTPKLINAVVVSVHDGDTINVIAEGDHNEYIGDEEHPQPIRLLGCNAYELRAKAPDGSLPGVAAQENLASLLPHGTPVVLSEVDDDKYAPRWDASVAVIVGGVVVDLVDLLVAGQWAAPWDGKGSPAPLPPWPRTAAA